MTFDDDRSRGDGATQHQASPSQRGPHVHGLSSSNADVALLIDWENLKYSLQNTFGVSANASSLMDAAGAYGRVVVARAYADWTQRQLTVDAVNLHRTGIEPVYVNAGEKNSADVRLAVDAVDLCMRMTHISTFVVVTGDKDLIHPINYIRLNGRRTVIIGVGATIAGRLVASVDHVLRYEEDLEPLVRTRGGPEPGQLADDARESLFQRVVAILTEQGDGREMPFAQLGNILKARMDFNAIQQFGKSFKALMLEAQDAGVISIRTEGLVDFAALPQERAGLDLDMAIRETATEAVAAPAFPPVPASGDVPEQDVDIDALSAAERMKLISYLHELGTDRRDLPIRYIADALTRNSVLPGLTGNQVWHLINNLADDGLLDRETAIGTARETGEPYEFTRLVLNPNHPLVADILAGRQQRLMAIFAELPLAVADVQTRLEFACESDVQQAFEQRIGKNLRALGFDRPSAFFRDAAEAGVVRLWTAPDETVVVLLPDEPAPETAAFEAWRSVLGRLDPLDLESAIRYIAAAEEDVYATHVEEAVQAGSLVYLLRGVLRTRTGETLGSDETNYLIKSELVERGILNRTPTPATHPETGIRSIVNVYQLNRENPEVQAALRKPLPQLPSNYRPRPAIVA